MSATFNPATSEDLDLGTRGEPFRGHGHGVARLDLEVGSGEGLHNRTTHPVTADVSSASARYTHELLRGNPATSPQRPPALIRFSVCNHCEDGLSDRATIASAQRAPFKAISVHGL